MNLRLSALSGCSLAGMAFGGSAQEAPPVHIQGNRIEVAPDGGSIEAYAVADNVVRVDFVPTGAKSKATEVMDPRGLRTHAPVSRANKAQLKTKALTVSSDGKTIDITDGTIDLRLDVAALKDRTIRLTHPDGENLYGMRGFGLDHQNDPRLNWSRGILRNDGTPVAAGVQGDGGAPFAFTTHWGLFVDSVDGEFQNQNGTLEFRKGSRPDVEAYIVFGPPKATISAVSALTGHPDLPPKWALGFMNSQWNTNQAMVEDIVKGYRQRQIPLDGFIFDFDYKAWGEDNFGELRWNSTSGPGSVGPNKYPDGQNGKFGAEMAAQGVHLVGIMKPRILLENADKTPTQAALEATAKHWFLPNAPFEDYFSNRPANNLDFSIPEERKWWWSHMRGLFDTGIEGWWNDESDGGFDSLGFLHMQQAQYDGQRSASDKRVWSINRNFYLGAQRFGFGEWSGDIGNSRGGEATVFRTMQQEPRRMLSTIDLDEPHWTMDTGGFNDHPTPEAYARWMEFAALVPIMRVHATYNERRQPWLFGPTAEAAAKRAVELRNRLKPSLYSWEREAFESGVGIVRPLFWEFPDDPSAAGITDSWMLGNGLLASPILEKGQTTKSIYLPPGHWFDYWTDKVYDGGKTLDLDVTDPSWSNIPLFVRSGTILATQPVEQYAGEKPPTEITFDVWPDPDRPARFTFYDDDGKSFAYQRGDFLKQEIVVAKKGSGELGGIPDMFHRTIVLEVHRASGRYHSSVNSFRFRLHLGGSGKPMEVTTSTAPSAQTIEIPAN